MIPWLIERTGAKKFCCPSADYIWPHTMNRKLREVVATHGGSIVGEEYFPLDHTDYQATIGKIMSSGAEVVFNTIVQPGLGPFLDQLHKSGFMKRGGHLACTYFEENFLSFFPPEQMEGLYSCLDYYQNVSDSFGKELLAQYDELYPDGAKFTAGSAATGMYRGLRLWEAAVKEAGSLKQEDVIKTLDHVKSAQGPRGPAEMVPGQHHVRMNMYIAQAKNGRFEIVKNLGTMDPKECTQGMKSKDVLYPARPVAGSCRGRLSCFRLTNPALQCSVRDQFHLRCFGMSTTSTYQFLRTGWAPFRPY
jgi:ABC-type branched-subunit amino acid transport system substrate-binding protein